MSSMMAELKKTVSAAEEWLLTATENLWSAFLSQIASGADIHGKDFRSLRKWFDSPPLSNERPFTEI